MGVAVQGREQEQAAGAAEQGHEGDEPGVQPARHGVHAQPAVEPGGRVADVRGAEADAGDMERATFSNFRTARRVFWEDTVLPQLSFYEEALQQMLVGPASRGERLRVRFDIGAIEALRENENDRASRRTAYVQAGIMTVDEARAELGLPGKGE